MTSGKKWGLLGTLVVGVLSLLVIALPGAAAARQHHKGHAHHKAHHKRHHRRSHRSGTQTGGGGTTTSGDEENAGTIASFDGTTLTITLNDGSMLSGMVTDNTEIKCEAAGDDNSGDGDNSGDDNSGDGDNSGTGGGGDDAQNAAVMSHSDDGGSGDDNSGDDNGDDNSGDGNGEQCTTADLTPGTQVSEAELSDDSSQPTFKEVELVK